MLFCFCFLLVWFFAILEKWIKCKSRVASQLLSHHLGKIFLERKAKIEEN